MLRAQHFFDNKLCEQEQGFQVMTNPTPCARLPLLLLPGLLCDAALWAHQQVHLADVAAIEVPVLTDDDTIPAMAQRVLRAAPPRFAVAGLSMGGYVALEILRQAPDRILGLCLVNSAARPDSPEQKERRRALVGLARTGRFAGVTPRLLPMLVHPERVADPHVGGVVLEMASRVGRDAFCRQQRAIMERADARPLLANLAAPFLAIVGRHDAITPPDRAEEAASLVPGGQWAMLEHCGHLSPLEQPVATTALLRLWLSWIAQLSLVAP
jgi:pimeloyl-ACP methyl ester carboxylesterase